MKLLLTTKLYMDTESLRPRYRVDTKVKRKFISTTGRTVNEAYSRNYRACVDADFFPDLSAKKKDSIYKAWLKA